MTSLHRAVLLAALLFLLLCGCHPASSDSPAQTCDPRLPATGHTQKVPDPVKPAACYGVVLFCNYCVYDESGQFKNSGTQLCGACVQKSFP